MAFRVPFLACHAVPLLAVLTGVTVRAVALASLNLATLRDVTAADVNLVAEVNVSSRSAGLVARYGNGGRDLFWGALTRQGGTLSADVWRRRIGYWARLASRVLRGAEPGRRVPQQVGVERRADRAVGHRLVGERAASSHPSILRNAA